MRDNNIRMSEAILLGMGLGRPPTFRLVQCWGSSQLSTVYTEFNAAGTSPAYFEYNTNLTRSEQQSIYLDGYKGIRNGVDSHAMPFRIYDTLSDPLESINLAALPAGDPRKGFFDNLQQKIMDEVLRLRRPHPVAKRAYDSELVPSLDPQDEAVHPMKVYRFEGDWKWTPRFDKLDAVSSDTVQSVSAKHLSNKSNAGLFYEGVVYVEQSGAYTFHTESYGGVVLKVHKALVIDHDYQLDSATASGSILLEAGYHPFSLYYSTGEGTPKLSLQLSGADLRQQDLVSPIL